MPFHLRRSQNKKNFIYSCNFIGSFSICISSDTKNIYKWTKVTLIQPSIHELERIKFVIKAN